MNWKRGLFRLWLLAATLWVVLPVWLFYETLERRNLAAKGLDACFAARKANPSVGNPFNCFDDLVPIGPQIAQYVAMALGPPITVFLLGYSLLWVLKGFRR